jgi:hypothetical protein
MPPAFRIRQGVALGAVLTALTPAAAAFAQGAGDQQYADPFGDDPTPTATPRRPAATATPAPPPAQTAATPAPAQPAPTATAARRKGSGKLPYTGFDGWPMALGGVALLGAGVTLRLRLREPD